MKVLIIITMLLAFAVIMTQTWFIEKKEREHEDDIVILTSKNFLVLRDYQDILEKYHHMMSMVKDNNCKVGKILLGNATEEEVSGVYTFLAVWALECHKHDMEYEKVKRSVQEMMASYKYVDSCEDDNCEEM